MSDHDGREQVITMAWRTQTSLVQSENGVLSRRLAAPARCSRSPRLHGSQETSARGHLAGVSERVQQLPAPEPEVRANSDQPWRLRRQMCSGVHGSLEGRRAARSAPTTICLYSGVRVSSRWDSTRSVFLSRRFSASGQFHRYARRRSRLRRAW